MAVQTTLAGTSTEFNADAFNKMHRRHSRALTRAINSGSSDAVLSATRAAVADWNSPDVCWPDDWSRWQRALDDHCGFGVYLIDDL